MSAEEEAKKKAVEEEPAAQEDRPDPPVAKDDYDADVVLLDRFQKFSSELLRLSLVCIGAVGFLLTHLEKALTHSDVAETLVAAAVVVLIIAAATALAHRYFSTDGLAEHIDRLRRWNRIEASLQKARRDARKATAQKPRGLGWRSAPISSPSYVDEKDPITQDEMERLAPGLLLVAAKAWAAKTKRDKDYTLSGRLLLASSWALGIGVALIGFAFIVVILANVQKTENTENAEKTEHAK